MITSDVEVGAGDSTGHTVQFLLDCKEKGRDLGNLRPPSIFMVPRLYRDLNSRSFTPSLVSIGPLHRRDKNLQKFEVQKMPYLHYLLDLSTSNPEQTLQECVQKVSTKIEQIKACYEESTTYNDDELARMMVIDACFILYFIHLLSQHDGPFQGNWSIAPLTVRDLVLIENQIPFFVLKDIFESTILHFKPNTSLTNHIKILLRYYNFFGEYIITSNISVETTDHDHILGFLHKFLQPTNDFPSASYSYPKRHSALELDRAGVNFRPNEDVNWVIAMEMKLPRFSWFPWFWCKPTLRMPKLHVHDNTELIIRNLIMYEQACLLTRYITAYAWAMDMLIDTAEDVAKLIKSGVLINDCGSNENAANMINRICEDVALDGFYYHQEWQDLDTYYNRYWPNAAAGLKRTYFSSPWHMVAVFAGIILFILTIVQTIFTIKAANPIIVTKH
ncbi:unnamed protein product [Lactuca saligna]|uniref:Uncharacterized protein n=1 Tax=Lactuca saligna TaxID=75948 RepID=A0AA35VCD6_LACSI|nr:unnamed protein product [Lactuca saligna]